MVKSYIWIFLGHGESITKFCLAHTIISRMSTGLTAQEATEQAMKDLTKRLNNTAGTFTQYDVHDILYFMTLLRVGAITLSNRGDVGIYHTSRRMAWAYQKGNEIHYGIDNNQHETETL